MDVERVRIWYHRPQVTRVVHILRWVILLAVFVGFFGWVSCASTGGCAPSPPGLNPSDLTAANLTVMNTAAGGPAKKTTINISDPAARAQLIDAYRSMAKWRQEGSGTPPSPDYSLELVLKNGERIVVVMQMWDAGLVVRRYKGETQKSIVQAEVGTMREYLLSKGTVNPFRLYEGPYWSNPLVADYPKAVKFWYDTYAPKLVAAASFLDSLEDPSNPTSEQTAAAKNLVGVLEAYAKGFEDIKPPADIAARHAEYLKTLTAEVLAATQLSDGLEKKDAASFGSAFVELVRAIDFANTTSAGVDQAVGFNTLT